MASHRNRYRLLHRLEAWLEAPMFVLAVVWLMLLVLEFTRGLTPGQERAVFIIWGVFIFEFLLKLVVAPDKWRYVTRNWLTVIALFIPAFRSLRLLRAVRLLRTGRVLSMTNFVRTITSGNRFWRALRRAQGPPPDPGMNVGILIAHSREADRERLRVFAERLAADVRPELEDAAGIPWRFHQLEMTALDTDAPRRPSDFLDEASLRMAEGPYDLLVVVTDLALISRRRRSEAGIASATTRIIALSTRKLTTTPRGERLRELSSPAVRWNAARLLLHLTGHVGGLRRHADGRSVMAPFRFQPQRTGITPFSPPERAILRRRSDELPERALEDGNLLETFIFSALMALRHPADVLRPLIRNRAPLLPLSLPSLATAAVAPSFLLIFSAEIWDVGLSMTNATATLFASISIVAASLYLVKVQSLFLPRKEKRVLTEHLAVANVVIFLSILLACLGLFVLVGGLMLIIEYYIFPPDLMHTWPTLNRPEVTGWDKIRLAAFIATTGVTTGALAGGLESRTVIQHLALFEDEP